LLFASAAVDIAAPLGAQESTPIAQQIASYGSDSFGPIENIRYT